MAKILEPKQSKNRRFNNYIQISDYDFPKLPKLNFYFDDRFIDKFDLQDALFDPDKDYYDEDKYVYFRKILAPFPSGLSKPDFVELSYGLRLHSMKGILFYNNSLFRMDEIIIGEVKIRHKMQNMDELKLVSNKYAGVVEVSGHLYFEDIPNII